MERKNYWETVYRTKGPEQVSWTQEVPELSLQFIRSFHLPKTARIIDVGGGDSNLVDHLLEEGFENITVLDISGEALAKAKTRLGERAKNVHWIESDVTEFVPEAPFDLWHDRAAFHFLTTDEEVATYVRTVSAHVNGYLVMGTFSEEGPKKCSGLDIRQYGETGLASLLDTHFDRIRCLKADHTTPFGTVQNFLFCAFRKRNA